MVQRERRGQMWKILLQPKQPDLLARVGMENEGMTGAVTSRGLDVRQQSHWWVEELIEIAREETDRFESQI